MNGSVASYRGAAEKVVALPAALVLWELAVRLLDVSPDKLPAPSTILMTIWSGRSVLATAVGTTLYEAVLGLVCGTAIGVLSGVVFSRFRLLERMFLPYWFRLPNFVLPTPQEIVSAALEDPQQLMRDTVATVTEAIGGYMAGSALGLAIAIAFVMLPIAGRLLMPLYVIVNSVPMIAYGPLAIILLGTGAASKVVLIIIAVSYTVLINAFAGLRDCDPGIVAMLRSFGASDRAILLKLRIPGAVPAIFSGLRVAVVHAMILAVVLEMLGASVGLGWSVYKSTQMMSFVEAWVAVSASVIVSLAVYGLVSFIGRRCIWW